MPASGHPCVYRARGSARSNEAQVKKLKEIVQIEVTREGAAHCHRSNYRLARCAPRSAD